MSWRRVSRIAALGLCIAGATHAWAPLSGDPWPDGEIPIRFDLVATAPANSSGDWEAAALEAMSAWNAKLQRVRLVRAPLEGEAWYYNGRNELFFDRREFDQPFSSGVVAATFITYERGVKVECDVVFNGTATWNVSHGAPTANSPVDFRRVAVHELGHVLGLTHPDEAGQTVSAVMNSRVSSVETPSADDEAGVRALYDFGLGAPPAISEHPKSTDTIQGKTVTLTVAAGGRGPLTYEWRRNGVLVPGGNQSRLQFIAGLADAGDYTVTIRNAAGATSSSVARVVVQPAKPPTLASLSDSQKNPRVGTGSNYSFPVNVLTGDTPMRFEWKRNGVSLGVFDQPGYTITDAQFSDAGTYTLIASNAAGEATSEPYRVSVIAIEPPRFLSDYAPITTDIGRTFAITADAEGDSPMTYQWLKDGVALAGQTSRQLFISSFQASDVGTYTAIAINPGGRAISSPIVVSLPGASKTRPIFTSMPSGRTVAPGVNTGFTATVEGADFGYRWFRDGKLVVDVPFQPTESTSISGSRSSTLQIFRASANDSGVYVLEASNALGTVLSRGARLTVATQAKPVITGQPSPYTVAVDGTVRLGVGVTLLPNVSELSTPSFTYQWFKNGTPISTESGLTFIARPADTGKYFVRVRYGEQTTDSATVDVEVISGPSPIIVQHPGSTYFDASNAEVIRLQSVAFEVARRRAQTTTDGAQTVTFDLVRASGPALGGVVPGTYVMTATRLGVTETSRPFSWEPIPPVPPTIIGSPDSQVVDRGQRVELTVNAVSTEVMTYRWFKDGAEIPGASSFRLTLPSFAASDAGSYRAAVANSAGSTSSETSTLELRPAGPPDIQVHPLSQTLREQRFGANLTVKAVGGDLHYQWLRNGVAISGATAERLDLFPFPYGPATAGAYVVVVTNGTSSVQSRTAQVTVLASSRIPEILNQPEDLTAPLGGEVTLAVTASGAPLPDRYQWRKDGIDLPGATDAKLRLHAVQPSDAGGYSVVVYNPLGNVVSRTARLTIDPTARLINLATRSAVGRGFNVLVAGFVIRGTAPRQVLVRGIGDQLADFGVTGALRDPVVSLYDATGKMLASNDDWFRSSDDVVNALRAAARQVGAFPQRDNAHDGALLATLAPGNYTAQVAGLVNTTGIGLLEIYEVGPPSAERFVNLSSRAVVGANADILIPGFVLSGQTPRRLLIRATGPALSELGVPGALSDPMMKVFRGEELIAQNDNWGEQPNAAQLPAAMAAVGAFPLKNGSRDAAMLIELPAGNYTVQVSGVGGATGVALVEIYDAAP